MRLTDKQRHAISEEVRRHFGANARALLFGSRLRNDLRGVTLTFTWKPTPARKKRLNANSSYTPHFSGDWASSK